MKAGMNCLGASQERVFLDFPQGPNILRLSLGMCYRCDRYENAICQTPGLVDRAANGGLRFEAHGSGTRSSGEGKSHRSVRTHHPYAARIRTSAGRNPK